MGWVHDSPAIDRDFSTVMAMNAPHVRSQGGRVRDCFLCFCLHQCTNEKHLQASDIEPALSVLSHDRRSRPVRYSLRPSAHAGAQESIGVELTPEGGASAVGLG